jgi:hypothetical protein
LTTGTADANPGAAMLTATLIWAALLGYDVLSRFVDDRRLS